jgi:hypothetical protein
MVVVEIGPHFTVVPGSNNEAVRDNTTNLVWERVPDTGQRNWADSVAYCPTKTVGGVTGWRLPSIDELTNLYPAPTPPFTYNTSLAYWSATTDTFIPHYSLLVDFGNGNVVSANGAGTGHAWCVRG